MQNEQPLQIHDKVKYIRTTGEVVRGFIDRASDTAVYIFNTATGEIVAAHRDRVERI